MKKYLLVLILFFSYDAFSQTAEEYFDRAYDKVENGDYYGGIADYTKAIELNPNDAIAYFNRGVAKNRLEDIYGRCGMEAHATSRRARQRRVRRSPREGAIAPCATRMRPISSAAVQIRRNVVMRRRHTS